jgi:DNA-binding transcriptional MerR regulator
MAHYDEGCIQKIEAIQYLQAKRFFPLAVIRNILRRMEEGLSLAEAESIENAVFASQDVDTPTLVDREAFLRLTGLTEAELQQAERLRLLLPYSTEPGKRLYDQDDIRLAREYLKKMLHLGVDLLEMDFYLELGEKIIDREMRMRRKLVQGKTVLENVRITTELARSGDFFRGYILRRLFQKKVRETIDKSLDKDPDA